MKNDPEHILTIESAKAYAARIADGVATFARAMTVDNMPMVRVRVRSNSYRVYWVDCWLEDGKLYGEY